MGASGAAAAAALLLMLAPAQAAATDVGVTVEISQPGVYGRVDIGRFLQPQVYVAQPVIVQPMRMAPQPVYMWVPPGHRKHWSRHCAKYGACGVPVYFVRDSWYAQQVRGADGRHVHGDEHRDGHHEGDHPGRGKDKGKSKDKDKDKDKDSVKGRGPKD